MATIATLDDGEGREWDFLTDGRIYDGWLDAFDGGFVLSGFDDTDGQAAWSMEGREFALSGSYSDGDVSALTTREIYVPDDGGFARYLDSFTNTGDQAISLQVTYLNSLGSDQLTNVLETSDGDTTLDANDTYFITDDSPDGEPGFDATVAEAWGDGSYLADSVTIGAYGTADADNPTITFTLDIAAGETVSLLMFATQSLDWDEAQVDTLNMRAPGVTWLAGLDAAERARVVNYDLAPDPTAPVVEVRDMTHVYDFAASGLADYDYLLDHSVDHIAWRTSGGHRVTAFGRGFEFDPGLRPEAGQITRIALDLGDDDHPTDPDMLISGLDIDVAGLDLSFGRRGNDDVWRQVLSGATTWLLGDATGGPSNSFAGDVAGAALGDDTMQGGAAADRLIGDLDSVGAGHVGGDDVLLGGAGNDTLLGDFGGSGGTGGNDWIDGEGGADHADGQGGHDTLRGGYGDDTLLGGAGDDWLYGQQQSDLMDGGGGSDVIFGGYGADSADGGLGADTMDGGDGFDVFSGGDGDDLLTGGRHGDTLFGDAGEDVLRGGAGHDALYGGQDNDSLYGWVGNDQLWGDAGNDWAEGGDGFDTLGGGSGNDTLGGGFNGDVIWGGDGRDRLFGHKGNDVIEGGAGDDWIEGGDHSDTVTGGAGSDTIYGGAGSDWLAGGGQTDTIFAGEGADIIEGQWGNDMLRGGGGADVFLFGSGSGQDTIGDFENGTDLLMLDGFTWEDVSVTSEGASRLVEWGANSVLLQWCGGVINAEDFLFA